jgi:hypothetical protein
VLLTPLRGEETNTPVAIRIARWEPTCSSIRIGRRSGDAVPRHSRCSARWTSWPRAVRRFQFFTTSLNSLRKFFHEEAPQGLTFTKFLQTLQGMTDKSYGRGETNRRASRTAR